MGARARAGTTATSTTTDDDELMILGWRSAPYRTAPYPSLYSCCAVLHCDVLCTPPTFGEPASCHASRNTDAASGDVTATQSNCCVRSTSGSRALPGRSTAQHDGQQAQWLVDDYDQKRPPHPSGPPTSPEAHALPPPSHRPSHAAHGSRRSQYRPTTPHLHPRAPAVGPQVQDQDPPQPAATTCQHAAPSHAHWFHPPLLSPPTHHAPPPLTHPLFRLHLVWPRPSGRRVLRTPFPRPRTSYPPFPPPGTHTYKHTGVPAALHRTARGRTCPAPVRAQ